MRRSFVLAGLFYRLAVMMCLGICVPSFAEKSSAKVTSKTPQAITCPKESGDGDDTPADQATDMDKRSVENFVGVTECWQADVSNEKQRYLNDLYSSIVVGRPVITSIVRDYDSERMSPVTRLFFGKTVSLLVSARIHVHDPDVDFTVPLLSIAYNGKGGQGEAFATTVTQSDMSQPFFRLTPNSSLSVTLDARSSKDADISAGGVVVGALKDALALAAPGSSLVTTVNSAQLNKIASTFDAGLSRIWSNSISEDSTTGRLFSEWYPNAAIYVAVTLPPNVRTFDDHDTKDPNHRYPDRRLWFKIQMTCPRLSIFDTTNVCEFEKAKTPVLFTKSAYAKGEYGTPGRGPALDKYVGGLKGRIDAHQVLNYNLAAGKTIAQFVIEQQWYATLTKTFTSPPSDSTTKIVSKIGEFCETVAQQLYNAGLSDLDAKIALWALADGLPDFVGDQQKFLDNGTCKEHLPGPDWLVVPTDAAPKPTAKSKVKLKAKAA